MHDRDLAGGPAEAQQRDARPDMHRLLHRYVMTREGARSGDCGDFSHESPHAVIFSAGVRAAACSRHHLYSAS